MAMGCHDAHHKLPQPFHEGIGLQERIECTKQEWFIHELKSAFS